MKTVPTATLLVRRRTSPTPACHSWKCATIGKSGSHLARYCQMWTHQINWGYYMAMQRYTKFLFDAFPHKNININPDECWATSWYDVFNLGDKLNVTWTTTAMASMLNKILFVINYYEFQTLILFSTKVHSNKWHAQVTSPINCATKNPKTTASFDSVSGSGIPICVRDQNSFLKWPSFW